MVTNGSRRPGRAVSSGPMQIPQAEVSKRNSGQFCARGGGVDIPLTDESSARWGPYQRGAGVMLELGIQPRAYGWSNQPWPSSAVCLPRYRHAR